MNATKAAPRISSVLNARQGPRPLVRMMVNSDVCASLAITKMVPISTVIGSSSYRCWGMLSATNSSACISL